MKVISVNVGRPRDVIWEGKIVSTGIFKGPVEGPVMARRLNLDGDGQGDLTVHGLEDKAIYVFPSEYYEYWRGVFPDLGLPWGSFGENVTSEGLFDDTVRIGDKFRIGQAEVVVTQPRRPCYKLNVKFGRKDMLQKFWEKGQSGIYLAVLKEGEIAVGDRIELLERAEDSMTIAKVARLFRDKSDVRALQHAIELPWLGERLRAHFRRKMPAASR